MRHEEKSNKLFVKMYKRTGWHTILRFVLISPVLIVPITLHAVATSLTYVSEKIDSYKPLVSLADWAAAPYNSCQARLREHFKFIRKIKRFRGLK